ncbi:MAG TPA: S8 family serine peptidase [Chitinophagaceae bacterium]|nr:S8 family serine peptidase [Chitinophagaceae bacterium]
MRKKHLLLFLMHGICFSAMSQVTTNVKVLQNFAHQRRIQENIEYAKAVAVANQKGWPLYRVGKNGTVHALQYIDQLGNPVYYTTFNNTIAAATTRANQLWPGGSSGLNLSGSSSSVTQKMGTWDGGLILKNHVELIGRVLQPDSADQRLSLNDHATHTTGTLIATGVNAVAKGMAFGLQKLIAYSFQYNEVSNISTQAPKLLVSNHSYGITGGWGYDGTNYYWNGDTTISTTKSYLCGWYGNSSQDYDSIAHNAPNYLMVFAAGNSNGNDANGQGPAVGKTYLYNDVSSSSVTRTASIPNNPTYGSVAGGQTAKNILVVGAVNGLPNGYSSANDVKIALFSSWGPTNDGRIKPDIVADGVNVTSSSSSSTTAYEALSGTSMAAPNTTGSLLLLQEYYNQKHPGAFMRSATLKALAIHTADEAGPSPGPDYVYGYGLLNVLKASSVITSSFNNKTDSVIEQTLTSGTPFTFNVVASGNGPLKATIVWTDPRGNIDNTYLSSSPVLINDLDLRITSGSSTYYPWILNPTVPTAAATKGDDKINNIEQVQIDSVVPGKSYTITVSNKGSLSGGSQAFSMILSGIGGTAYCTSASTNTTGSRIDSVAFSNIANKNAAGHSSYSNFTNLTANIQPNQTIPISIKVNSSDGSSANRVLKVYIDYNNNGSFADAGELVAFNVSNISSISGTGGTFTANITTPNGLTVGNYGIMRIVLQDSINGTATSGPCNNYSNGETQDYRFQVVSPDNDVAVVNIVSPNSGACLNGNQYLVVAVKNNGSVNQTNVPLVATITNGTSVTTFTATYPLLTAGNTVNYTFQTAFAITASATYTIKSYTNLSTDQNKSNDTSTLAVTIAAKPTTPTGTAEICGNTVMLVVSNPNSAANYLWSSASTANAVIASSTPTSSTSVLTNYYLSSGINGNVGITSKNNFPNGGGYQANGGNYMNYTSSVPLTLVTARLFTGYAGQVTIIAADISNVNTTTGQYSYLPLATATIDAYATKPTPIAGSQAINDPADTGAVFYINLPLPSGSHSIICITDTAATIFRNNNITGNPYPIGISNVFTLTGNSATSSTNPTFYQGFYYYLYNLNIQTSDCVSDMGTIVPITAPTPVASANGNILSSDITTGKLQWNLNGIPITGATNSTYTNTQTVKGTYNYSVTVTDVFGCSRTSNTVAVVVTAVQNVNSAEISLVVSPNPNNGVFHVGFTTNTLADVSVELINTAGQICLNNSYSNFVGQFSQQFSTNNLASGTYILKVQQNGKVYQKQVMIIK